MERGRKRKLTYSVCKLGWYENGYAILFDGIETLREAELAAQYAVNNLLDHECDLIFIIPPATETYDKEAALTVVEKYGIEKGKSKFHSFKRLLKLEEKVRKVKDSYNMLLDSLNEL